MRFPRTLLLVGTLTCSNLLSAQIIITGAGATASFTVSPANPAPNQAVQFNGSDSTGSGGAAITKWDWDFGDGGVSSESDASTSHTYTAEGTFVVRLTVTDSAGRTGTTTKEVTVKIPE